MPNDDDLMTSSEEQNNMRFVDARVVGNQWMTIRDGDVTRYLSDQWNGRVFGFEMRTTELYGDVHFAQTGQYVLGILGVGGGSSSVWRGLKNGYGWHHLARDYSAADTNISSAALAQAIVGLVDRDHLALEIYCDRGVLWGSGLAGDLQPETERLRDISKNVQEMADWATTIGKTFIVDCISLSLMEAETAPWTSMVYEYGMAVRRIRDEITNVTGQVIPPQFIISQHAGTRSDGRSGVALAEAGAMIDLWGLDVTIATPKYHLPIEANTPSRLTPASARYVSEMEAHAHLTRRAGKQWFCPLMTLARRDGNVITVSFTLEGNSSLVLDDPENHGFSLAGETADKIKISAMTVEARSIKITLSEEPNGPIDLCYAWGQSGDRGDGYPANRGSLRDNWSAPSAFDPQVTLYRRALSQRLTVFPSETR